MIACLLLSSRYFAHKGRHHCRLRMHKIEIILIFIIYSLGTHCFKLWNHQAKESNDMKHPNRCRQKGSDILVCSATIMKAFHHSPSLDRFVSHSLLSKWKAYDFIVYCIFNYHLHVYIQNLQVVNVQCFRKSRSMSLKIINNFIPSPLAPPSYTPKHKSPCPWHH